MTLRTKQNRQEAVLPNLVWPIWNKYCKTLSDLTGYATSYFLDFDIVGTILLETIGIYSMDYSHYPY